MSGGIFMRTYSIDYLKVVVIEDFWFQFMEYRVFGIMDLLFCFGACWMFSRNSWFVLGMRMDLTPK